MGCFSFIDSWLVKRKQKRRDKKLRLKQGKLDKKANASDSADKQEEVNITKQTTGGVAFEVEVEPKPKPLNAPPLKPAKTFLQDAQSRAIMADINRREALRRKGEAAREAERKREEYAKRRAEENKRYQERARVIVESQILPDEATVKANLEKLAKRCKTARRRKKVSSLLPPLGPPKSVTAEGAVTDFSN